MSKKKRQPRPRTERRSLARRLSSVGQARYKLSLLEPGGTPERPIAVETAAVVEARASAFSCLVCEGAMRCEAHEATAHADRLLRVVSLRCASCGAQRRVYFDIVPERPN